ncbi:MAG TPA: copper chaperone [Crocinitomicaceae bacterium]|nr:copper chaperone [Crocinitomicaceae bacterium]
MEYTIIVQNLKCGGCASTITKGIDSIDGLDKVNVDVDTSAISFTTNNDTIDNVLDKLAKMGYPAEGESNSLGQKTKSFVSCAVGKMSN